jgi:hypothetical protein
MATAIITISDKEGFQRDINITVAMSPHPETRKDETPAQNAAMVMIQLFQAQARELGIPQTEKQ